MKEPISKINTPMPNSLLLSYDNAIRERISQEIKHKVGQAIHASAVVDRIVNLAEGVQIIQGAVVNRGSSLGKHTIINTNATVDHDRQVEILFTLHLEQLSVGVLKWAKEL